MRHQPSPLPHPHVLLRTLKQVIEEAGGALDLHVAAAAMMGLAAASTHAAEHSRPRTWSFCSSRVLVHRMSSSLHGAAIACIATKLATQLRGCNSLHSNGRGSIWPQPWVPRDAPDQPKAIALLLLLLAADDGEAELQGAQDVCAR